MTSESSQAKVERFVGWDEELVERAVEMYRSGVSSLATAKAVGVTAPTVIRWARKAGVPIRPIGRPTGRMRRSTTIDEEPLGAAEVEP